MNEATAISKPSYSLTHLFWSAMIIVAMGGLINFIFVWIQDVIEMIRRNL